MTFPRINKLHTEPVELPDGATLTWHLICTTPIHQPVFDLAVADARAVLADAQAEVVTAVDRAAGSDQQAVGGGRCELVLNPSLPAWKWGFELGFELSGNDLNPEPLGELFKQLALRVFEKINTNSKLHALQGTLNFLGA